MGSVVRMLALFLVVWSAPSAALTTVEQAPKRPLVANVLKHAALASNESTQSKPTRNQGAASATRTASKASDRSVASAVANVGLVSAKQARVGRVPALQAASQAAVGLGRGVVQKAQSVE